MKKYALGAAALILSCISWSVAAADKPTLEERCRAIAKQHGMPAEEVDAWVEKCLDHTKAMMARHPQGEQKQPHEDKSGQPGEEQQHTGGRGGRLGRKMSRSHQGDDDATTTKKTEATAREQEQPARRRAAA